MVRSTALSRALSSSLLSESAPKHGYKKVSESVSNYYYQIQAKPSLPTRPIQERTGGAESERREGATRDQTEWIGA